MSEPFKGKLELGSITIDYILRIKMDKSISQPRNTASSVYMVTFSFHFVFLLFNWLTDLKNDREMTANFRS